MLGSPAAMASPHRAMRGVYYLPLTLADRFRVVKCSGFELGTAGLPCGDDSTIAKGKGLQERALGGALVHSDVQTHRTPGLTCV